MTKTTYPDTGKIIKAITDRINVKEIANIIRDSIKDNMDNGINADGTKMQELAKETIRIKKAKGGIAPSKPLIFKGGSQKGVKSTGIDKKNAVVTSTGMAKDYYGKKNISSKKMFEYQALQARDPFGVSEEADKQIDKYIRRKLGGQRNKN